MIGRPARTAFRTDTRGATAVEFGLVALPFLVMLLAAFQLTLIFFSSQALETFTETNSRQILVGLIQQQNLNATQYRQQLCAKLPSLFNCNNFYVDVVSIPQFANADLTLPTLNFDSNGNVTNTWRFQPGSPGDIIVVRMLYEWSVFNLSLGLTLVNQTNGSRLLMATSVFRNEQTN